MGCSESILLNFEFEPSSDPLEAESVVSLSTLRFFDGLFVLKMGSNRVIRGQNGSNLFNKYIKDYLKALTLLVEHSVSIIYQFALLVMARFLALLALAVPLISFAVLEHLLNFEDFQD